MAKNLFSRYIWIVDTIKSHGSITLEELNAKWRLSPYSNGDPLPRRTFYNYRQAIEDLFKINIECNPSTFEYYIADEDLHNESMTDWLLNSTAISSMLGDSREISDRIFLEDVPSARKYLSIVIEALKGLLPIRFTYQPFTRVSATPGITLEPYFLKIFKQRWYVTGKNRKERKIKTYALDRMSKVVLLQEPFEYPVDFDPEEFTKATYGVVFTQGETKRVVIKADMRQAKYFRALPLHASQQEMVHDDYSIFTYNLRITPDFVHELLSYGESLMVLEPAELRAMVTTSLEKTLAIYKKGSSSTQSSPLLDVLL